MPTGLKIAVGIAAAVIVGGGAVWLWSHFQQAPGLTPAPGPAPAPKWDDSYGSFSDAGVYLLPIGPKESVRHPAQDVWKSLLPGMASDAATKTLLCRLYNDLPVDFMVLPGKAAKEKEMLDRAAGPPEAGFTAILRVAAEQPLRDAGGGDLFGSLGCRRDMRVRPGKKSANFVEKDGNAVSSRPPDDFSILLLAMNDYLLRTGAGYGVFDGGPSTPQSIRTEFPTQDIDAMRANLDRRIAKYLEGYHSDQK